MRIFILILGLFYNYCASATDQKDWMMLGGIYYDNVFNVNAKFGVAHYLAKTDNSTLVTQQGEIEKFIYPSFIYADYTYSKNSNSIGLGWGKINYATNYRIGVAYVKQKDNELVGIEGVLSLLFYSFKAGVFNSKSNRTSFMIGVGFGW